jgi:hypothetical protein
LGLNAVLGNSRELAGGETDTGESAPLGATLATVVPSGAAWASSPPLGLNATDDAPRRDANGEPGTGVNNGGVAADAPGTPTEQNTTPATRADHNQTKTSRRTTASTPSRPESCADA